MLITLRIHRLRDRVGVISGFSHHSLRIIDDYTLLLLLPTCRTFQLRPAIADDRQTPALSGPSCPRGSSTSRCLSPQAVRVLP